jgi:hypothetical protein
LDLGAATLFFAFVVFFFVFVPRTVGTATKSAGIAICATVNIPPLYFICGIEPPPPPPLEQDDGACSGSVDIVIKYYTFTL